MKILVIGRGGREHAIICALKKSPRVEKIYCAPGNGGISCDAINVPIDEMDKEKMRRFAKNERIDFAVVAPDNPLAEGMVDFLESGGIPCFGPTKKAAQIESSKIFAKKLMEKYNIPTAAYQAFDDAKTAIEYLKHQKKYPAVIKADGLALGKGVIIADDFEKASQAVSDMILNQKFGSSGKKIVIEEFLTGPEISVLCLTDGKTIKPMLSSMDHKRAFDSDIGPNTGGMGAIAPNPAYSAEVAKECMEKIFIPTIKAMESEGCAFSGCLYFGLMLTPNGPKVIEYNCRFGDPETQAVLPLLETDLLEIMQAIKIKRLEDVEVRFSKKHSACVIIASQGYPKSYSKGFLISGLDENGQLNGAKIYHAGTTLENGQFKTSGGRVLGISTTADSLEEAIDLAYDAAYKIRFQGSWFRKDIGKKALEFS